MKKVLVTGGAGFIGSHLCERILQKGKRVICLDNLHTGSYSNVESLIDNRNFTFVKADVLDDLDYEVDEIYNLACPASPVHYQKDPVLTARICFEGTLNILELARKNNARVLHTSTSEIYGEPMIHPQIEGYHGNVNNIGPRACYDEGKRIAETLIFDYIRCYALDAKVIRIFNTYGPKMMINDGRVISNFITKALKNDPIHIYGDGRQTRSFCYIDDLLDGLLLTMKQKYFSGPVNIGNPYEISINEVANKIKTLTNSSSDLVYRSLPSDDPTRRKPDISLAKDQLGWQPHVTLDEGLERTISYYLKCCV